MSFFIRQAFKFIGRFFFFIVSILESIVSNLLYRSILRPFIIGLPTCIVTMYKVEPINKKISFVLPEFNSFIDNYGLILALSYLVFPVFISLEELIVKVAGKYKSGLGSEGLIFLIKAIDLPVEKKMNRFLNFIKNQQQKEIKSAEIIFNEITQPDIQIAEIVRSIHIVFEGMATLTSQKHIEFSTVLFRMEDSVPVQHWCFFPESAHPESALLNDQNCLVACASMQSNMIVIEDIRYEKSKRSPRISLKCVTESGSAICYPIRCRHRGITPLAIRVVASGSFFQTENKKLYKQIFERFEKRILIEYALSEVKNYAAA